MPPIEGLRDSHVMTVDEALPRLDVIEAKRYAVLGGGLAGLEQRTRSAHGAYRSRSLKWRTRSARVCLQRGRAL